MTDQEFAKRVDEILAIARPKSHGAHRALDILWTRYAMERGGPIADATQRWMAHIEGDHSDDKPYPLGQVSWWKRPLPCKFGRHEWIDNTSGLDYGSVYDCPRCGAHQGYGNPCP